MPKVRKKMIWKNAPLRGTLGRITTARHTSGKPRLHKTQVSSGTAKGRVPAIETNAEILIYQIFSSAEKVKSRLPKQKFIAH
jgi:hypothetical protein